MTHRQHMTDPEHREIERRLREVEAPQPPPDLLDELTSEIPERPVVVTREGEQGDDARGGARRHRHWLVAASAVAAVLVGLLALEVRNAAPPPPSMADAESVPKPAPAAAERRLAEAPSREGVATGGVETRKPEESGAVAVPGSGADDSRTQSEPPARLADEVVERVGRAVTEPPAETPSTVGEMKWRRTVRDQSASANRPEAPTVPEVSRRPTEMAPIEERQRAARDLAPLGYAAPVPDTLLRVAPEASVVQSEAAPMPLAEPAPPRRPGSTGGTAEPNDAPYGDTFFESYGVNPFIDTEDDKLSTFAMDVDTGSYTVARSYLNQGHLPPPAAIRVEEMVNFFDYGDEPPSSSEADDGVDFAIHAEGAPTPFAESPAYRLLRFNLRAREVDPADRKPATLIFVVDVSGSMNRENRLGLVKRSLSLLLDRLRPDDRVGLVVYGSRGEVLLEPTGDHERIRSAVDRLAPGGSTNAEEGLVLAYELAERFFRAGAVNRIVLCSDGVANVGRTGADSILERIGESAERGIELTAVGFGMGNYNDVLMERLADRGDGNYAYVDGLDEARRVFVENLTGTLQTIAREAKIQVEFDPGAVSRYRLLGYENRDVADERFRDDTVDAGEIGAGHSVTALYEIKLRDGIDRQAPLATLRLRYQPADGGEVVEVAHTVRADDLAPSWERASRGLRLASVVAELAEVLRRSYWARESDPGELLARAQAVSAEYPGDVDVAELVGLIGKTSRLAHP